MRNFKPSLFNNLLTPLIMKSLAYGFLIFLVSIATLQCERINDIDDNPNILNDTISINDSISKPDPAITVDTCSAGFCYSCILDSTEEQLFYTLMDGFNKSSSRDLKDFLDKWAEEYEVKSHIPDSLEDVYAIYKEFYSPWELGRITGGEYKWDGYPDITYYIIQSTISYNFNYDTSGTSLTTIDEFRPAIANETKILLSLTDQYSSVINCFLGSDTAFWSNTKNRAYIDEDEYLKYEYLSSHLKFHPGHWGNYWHIKTHPAVSRISFNESMDSALVYYYINSRGGEVVMGKSDGEWGIVDSYLTWIE